MPRMHYPNVLSQMEDAGYVFGGHARCSNCRAQIEYWTPPGSQRAMFEIMPTPISPVRFHHCAAKRPSARSIERQRSRAAFFR